MFVQTVMFYGTELRIACRFIPTNATFIAKNNFLLTKPSLEKQHLLMIDDM